MNLSFFSNDEENGDLDLLYDQMLSPVTEASKEEIDTTEEMDNPDIFQRVNSDISAEIRSQLSM